MEEYGRYEFNQNQNQYQPVQPEAPKDPKKNHDNLKKFAKRAGAIALSAVLFGGIAGGTMVGIKGGRRQYAGLRIKGKYIRYRQRQRNCRPLPPHLTEVRRARAWMCPMWHLP